MVVVVLVVVGIQAMTGFAQPRELASLPKDDDLRAPTNGNKTRKA